MTAKRSDIASLPYWPLYLSREQAAAYLGVSPNVFDAEVSIGKWPPPESRGLKGGRRTWYRPGIDRAAAVRNGDLGGDDGTSAFEAWRSRIEQRRKDRPKAARGRS